MFNHVHMCLKMWCLRRYVVTIVTLILELFHELLINGYKEALRLWSVNHIYHNTNDLLYELISFPY